MAPSGSPPQRSPTPPADRWHAEGGLRDLFKHAPGLIAVLSGPEHVFELVNDAYQRTIGDRQVIGKTVREALPELVEQGFVELLDRVYRRGEPYVGRETRALLRRSAEGPLEEGYFDFLYHPLTGPDGAVSGIFIQGIDVTDRKRAEAELRRTEERLRLALTAGGGIGTWVWEVASDRLYGDEGLARLFSLDPARAAAGIRVAAALHAIDAADRPRVEAAIARAIDTGDEYQIEYRIPERDGSTRWVAARGRCEHGADGKPTRFPGVVLDITDRKRAEAELRRLNEGLEQRVADAVAERLRAEETLRQSQKMEVVGQLTGGVAHDFNNLLTAILGNLEMVEMGVTDERLRRMVQAAARAAQRGAKLTDQLLVFSRKRRLAPKPVDLGATVRGLSDMLRRTLGGTIEIRTSLGDGLWSAVVDPTQIELAILNLAINARDAMPDGGALLIETRNVTFQAFDREAELPPGNYVMVAVADTGEGMSDDVLVHAFEPFYTTKEVGKGSGLGLSQVYGLMRQSGGGVRIRSALGRGTRVEMILPRAGVAAAGAGATEEGEVLADRRGTVLVVDDQDDVRKVAVAYVETLGYDAVEAASGREAVDLLEAGRPVDLLLVDYAMPGMSGTEVMRAARVRRPDLPVVIVSGYAEARELGQSGAGAAFLRKPYRLHELAATLDLAFRDHTPARA